MTVMNTAPPHGEENDGQRLEITAFIMTIAAGLLVVLRIWKRRNEHSLGWDDYVIVGASVWCLSVSTSPLTN